jgi:hypothetical protein
MNLRQICLEESRFLEGAFRKLEGQVPPPSVVAWKEGVVARYAEKLPKQAILLKFARLISGLNAIDALLMRGFLQEQAVIQRTLDEISEDIVFLAIGVTGGQLTNLHSRFLDAFWKEELTTSHWTTWTHDREAVPRKKIRAAINRACGQSDPSTADKAGRSISSVYSGYVHAAAPHIMDMYDGNPPRFLLSGQLSTLKFDDYAADAVNYFYRALMSANFASKAFGDEELAAETYQRVRGFEQAYGFLVLPEGHRSKGTK